MTSAGAPAAALVLVAACSLRAGLGARRRMATVRRAHGARPERVSADGVGAHAGRDTGGSRSSRLAPPAWLAARLADAGVGMAATTAWAAWVAGSATVTGVATLGAGAGAGLLAGAGSLGGPWLGWRLLRHRGAAGLEAALPAAVEAVASSLRTGASLRQAVSEAAGATPGLLGADLAQVAATTERGGGLVAALEGWAVRRPLPGVGLAVAALCLCAETGGAAAQAVDAVAATLRQRLAAQAEARALATQARASAAVIAVAPVAFCALSTAADPQSSAFLLQTRVGLVLLAAGLALDAAGAVWMARLTRVEP